MRIMGLDLGDATIGVAISDEMLWFGQAITVIRRIGWKQDIAKLKILVDENDVKLIVVGLPKNMDGSIGERAEICMKFSNRLSGAFEGVKVDLWDERLTTVSAERMLISADVRREKRKQVIDKTAAAIILQSYLDARQNREKSILQKQDSQTS
ncbi:MAG: Holliday junction resolvase RuvX [Bacillota bacterium]